MKPAQQIFALMKEAGCRQITFHRNPRTDLKLVWVIDSLPEKRDKTGRLQQDLSVSGGIRFAHHDTDVALQDALRLAQAMSRKAQVLGVDEGGAKAVVIANKKKDKKFLQSIGDFVQLHKGLFRTAVDLGFTMVDGKVIASRSGFVDSLSHLRKGLGSTGENTAEGMLHGFDVICAEILKKPLSECSVAIQGLGAVGFALAQRLIKKGCRVIGADTSKPRTEKARKIGVTIVPPEKVLFQKVDILSPCALGGVINKKTIPRLRCKVIAGGANNQLEHELTDEKLLLEREIVFIPDFVLNCAGFLQALMERSGGTVHEARQKSAIVGKKLQEVLKHSREHRCTLLESALLLFNRRFPS